MKVGFFFLGELLLGGLPRLFWRPAGALRWAATASSRSRSPNTNPLMKNGFDRDRHVPRRDPGDAVGTIVTDIRDETLGAFLGGKHDGPSGKRLAFVGDRSGHVADALTAARC